ncbi:hypothetical protein [Streptomyces sp. NPDC091215]|uniref:hypothetical protein n=1 Tax=Streptomyces sp. NPDC091215 TaxID=3155192 RepID=UPI00343057E0
MIVHISPNQMLQGIYRALIQGMAEHAITAQVPTPGHRAERLTDWLDVHVEPGKS